MALNRRGFLGTALVSAARAARPADAIRAIEESIFESVNRERVARKLPALHWNNQLAAEARRHSEEMDRKRYFSHNDPQRGNLGRRLDAAGIDYSACGENLYAQPRPHNAAPAALKAWLNSRGHRSNLLNAAYRETAIGVAVGSNGRCSITQIFMSRPVAT